MPFKKGVGAKGRGVRASLTVRGFRASGVSSGIKKNGRKDLALILSDVPAAAAGVFTRNSVKAAPVVLDIKRLQKGRTFRGLIVNSGNANACTGKNGHDNALRMTSLTEDLLGLETGEVLVSSTGVIGVPLPMKKAEAGIRAASLRLRPSGLKDAAEAIMTTDAYPKTASGSALIGGVRVKVAGIAKGAGMIKPDMATLLAYFFTDAAIKTALNVGRRFRSSVLAPPRDIPGWVRGGMG